MTSFRDHLKDLAESDDLLTVSEPIHWNEEAATIAAEALRNNCAALRFESTPGTVRLASGVYAGPDQISSRNHRPRARIGEALELGREHDYVGLLDALSKRKRRPLDQVSFVDPAATVNVSDDLHSLGLPTVDTNGRQAVTLGIIAVERDGRTSWAPVHGEIHRRSRLRLTVPQRFVDWSDGERSASIMLGLSAASLIAALQGWILDRTTPAVPELAAGLGNVPLADVDGRVVPADAEVRIDGIIDVGDKADGPSAIWERACETTSIAVRTDNIVTRSSPIIPFVPLSAPLTDDLHLTSLVKSAELYRRINSYWGISPASWVQLPVENRLGVCLVSSEILYSGFEWQLANALFSFSSLFDKVLILDEQIDPTNLARAFDDIWVKAHPGNDWVFSDPNAPAASAPMYRQDGKTGSRLYISATWDPRWDEEYIAPRVDFESSFPEDIRESVLERWADLKSEGIIK